MYYLEPNFLDYVDCSADNFDELECIILGQLPPFEVLLPYTED